MTGNGMATYVELNDEVRRLRERLAQFESSNGAAQPAALSAQHQIQLMIDHLPQSICWKDRNSVFLGCNLLFARGFGVERPADLIGKTDYDLTSPELAEIYRADDLRVMESGVAKVNFEEPLLHPNGTKGWLLTSKIPLREGDGSIVGVLVTLEDITARKQAEEERIRTQDEYIQMQAGLLAELSTPLIPLTQAVVVMPLIGSIDSRRAQQVLDTLLHGITERHARIAILDITGVPIVDTHVAGALIRAAQAAQLLGAQVVLTGIRPEVAQTLVGMGTDLQGIVTRSDLQSGISFATQYR